MKVLDVSGRPENGCAVTIGAFDGVHQGHRALIEAMGNRARQLGVAAVVITFDRHPAAVVRPQSAPRLLTDLDQKLELLAATGIDYTLVLPFDAARAAEPADDFVRQILVDRLRSRAVVVGHDFHFGRGRAGNVELLRTMGIELGFTVTELAPLAENGGVISSTAIRSALVDGDVAMANTMLGRAYEVRGLVVMGDGRGRELGFPTANVHIPTEVQLPADGVYAGEYVLPDGAVRSAAISVGTRPHFYADGVHLVEAYVLDFSGDLYGQHARLRFVERLRGQQKFGSLDELVVQITNDVADVQALMG